MQINDLVLTPHGELTRENKDSPKKRIYVSSVVADWSGSTENAAMLTDAAVAVHGMNTEDEFLRQAAAGTVPSY